MVVWRLQTSPSSFRLSSSCSVCSSSCQDHLTRTVRSEVRGHGSLTSVEGEGLGRNYRRSKVEFTESKLAGDWQMTEIPVATVGFL
jgi:hypothetical protein